jgi:hypothetical protein
MKKQNKVGTIQDRIDTIRNQFGKVDFVVSEITELGIVSLVASGKGSGTHRSLLLARSTIGVVFVLEET